MTTATSIDFGKYLPAEVLTHLVHPALRLAWLAEMRPEIVRSHFQGQPSIQKNRSQPKE